MLDILDKCKELSIEQLEKIVAEKMSTTGNYFRSFWPNLEAPRLYRARIHNHLEGNIGDGKLQLFTEEKEFWNPPAEFAKLGRCNDINQSLLYCSNDWQTAIAEVRPKAGDYLSIAIYHLKKVGLGSRISPIGIQYLSQIEELATSKMFEDYKATDQKEIIEIDNFLDELFHLEVNDEEKYKYKLSVAVTNCLMKNIQIGDTLQSMHGVMYSSIVRNKHNYNLVLLPNHTRHIYSLFQVQSFKVVRSDNEKYLLELRRNGYTMGTKNHPLDYFQMHWKPVPQSADNYIEI